MLQAKETPKPSPSKLILLGASTGGVDALLTVLSSFPKTCPPTIVVQHTGSGFGKSLADLLDRRLEPKVELLSTSSKLEIGKVILGAGQSEHLSLRHPEYTQVGFKNLPPVSGHLPSVDVLFRSAVDIGTETAAALLTGMGKDGASGLKALKDAGAFTIAQDEASSVVYGMPRAAVEIDAACQILPLDQIGPTLLAYVAKNNTISETRK